METTLKDFELIENANLTAEVKFAAQMTVGAVHFLRGLSAELGIPTEQITAEHIISALSTCDSGIFNVALSETGIMEGKPLLDAVNEFTALVEGIVATLTPRLR